MNHIIKDYADIALSDKEVLNLVNQKANLVLYPDIYKYDTIDELLGEHQAAIILFESQPNYGHWVSIFRNDNNVEFFNSYGGYPDGTLKHIDKEFRRKSHQDKPYLTKLLVDSPYNIHMNPYRFQKKEKDVKTCGRHAAVRILFRNLSSDEYKDMLDYLREVTRLDYDGVVTLLTMYINK